MIKPGLYIGTKSIKNIATGSFRSRLYLEDVHFPDRVIAFRGVNTDSEIVHIYDFPLQYPKINRFYTTKIRDINDEFIPEVIRRLVFINGFMNKHSRKKMVEYMLLFLTQYRDNKPVVTYEEMFPLVDNMISRGQSRYNELVMQNVVTLFSRHSRLTPAEKKGITLSVRSQIATRLHGELIHNAASTAIEISRSYMQVTKPKVLEQTESSKITTVKTLSRYMREDTVAMLEHANYGRPFKKDVIVAKFLKFLQDPDKTTVELAASLNTSKSTIVKFRELKERNILEEPRESYI